MFTQNFYNRVLPNLLAGKEVSGMDVTTVSGKLYSSISLAHSKNFYGSAPLAALSYLNGVAEFKEGVGGTASSGVYLGSGNEPATRDDIALSGSPISEFTYSKTVETKTFEEYLEHIALYTITNTNDAAITIGEIGIFGYIKGRNSQYGDDYYYPVLLERTVLETPITIEPGGVGQVTYTIRMNYPA